MYKGEEEEEGEADRQRGFHGRPVIGILIHTSQAVRTGSAKVHAKSCDADTGDSDNGSVRGSVIVRARLTPASASASAPAAQRCTQNRATQTRGTLTMAA